MIKVIVMAGLAAILLGAAAQAQARKPCIAGDQVDRRCPDSPLYNRRGVDISQPGRSSGNPFATRPSGAFGSTEGLTEQQRRLRQRNGGN